MLKLLNKDGVDVNELYDELGRNFLHVAASAGRNLAVTIAVRSGMDVTRTTVAGKTAEMLAVAWGRTSTSALLLELS